MTQEGQFVVPMLAVRIRPILVGVELTRVAVDLRVGYVRWTSRRQRVAYELLVRIRPTRARVELVRIAVDLPVGYVRWMSRRQRVASSLASGPPASALS